MLFSVELLCCSVLFCYVMLCSGLFCYVRCRSVRFGSVMCVVVCVVLVCVDVFGVLLRWCDCAFAVTCCCGLIWFGVDLICVALVCRDCVALFA